MSDRTKLMLKTVRDAERMGQMEQRRNRSAIERSKGDLFEQIDLDHSYAASGNQHVEPSFGEVLEEETEPSGRYIIASGSQQVEPSYGRMLEEEIKPPEHDDQRCNEPAAVPLIVHYSAEHAIEEVIVSDSQHVEPSSGEVLEEETEPSGRYIIASGSQHVEPSYVRMLEEEIEPPEHDDQRCNEPAAVPLIVHYSAEHAIQEVIVSDSQHVEPSYGEVLEEEIEPAGRYIIESGSQNVEPSYGRMLEEDIERILEEETEPAGCDYQERDKLSTLTKPLVAYSSNSEDYSSDNSHTDPTFTFINPHPRTRTISTDSDELPEEHTAQPPTRWRKRDPQNWKVNIIKNKRSMCLPYNNKTKDFEGKNPKQANCSRCRFHCNDNFTELERTEICKSYWGLKDFQRQKDFIIQCVKTIAPKRRKIDESSSAARSVSKSYYLQNPTGRFRVCASFFQKTLCISNGPINTAIAGTSSTGTFDGIDRRGRKSPGNKTSDEQIKVIKEHIESFPCMESHYVRKKTQKKYLDSQLSILKMYALYKEKCSEKQIAPVSEFIYRKVFCTSYNLSFFKPKKDQCPICSRFDTGDINKKKDMEIEYSQHIIRKNECNAKENDKDRCKNDNTFITANFDLQSVLQLPYSSVSQFYYTRKICVYNLTIYEGEGNNAYCYYWNELNGKRGSNEIASILLYYIEHLPSTVKEMSLFSDTCGGQNRNQQVAAALLYAVKHTHLNKIELKFLESGHTHMECDSMHSAIENAKRNKTAYTMNDWTDIFKNARSGRSTLRLPRNQQKEPKPPYQLRQFKFSDFKDFQALASKTIRNRNRDELGDQVSWLKIKCLKFQKTTQDILFYRYDHKSEYKRIFVAGNVRRRKEPEVEPQLFPVYNRLLPISKKKKEDLEKVCRMGLVPEETHLWYQSLPVTAATDVERLPEPDADETDHGEE